jgi:uncharacterized Zn finger protein
MSDNGNRKRSGGSSSSGKNRRSSSSRNRRRKSKQQVKKFWNEGEALPPLNSSIALTPDPAAVVRSLGKPPLAGQDEVANSYFELVYGRAVGLAGALAAAAGLDVVQAEDDGLA